MKNLLRAAILVQCVVICAAVVTGLVTLPILLAPPPTKQVEVIMATECYLVARQDEIDINFRLSEIAVSANARAVLMGNSYLVDIRGEDAALLARFLRWAEISEEDEF